VSEAALAASFPALFFAILRLHQASSTVIKKLECSLFVSREALARLPLPQEFSQAASQIRSILGFAFPDHQGAPPSFL
jgi:hypothetical protein